MSADITSVELAARLDVDPKRFRAWLRQQAAAGHPLLRDHRHGAGWTFAPETAVALADAYQSGHAPSSDTVAVTELSEAPALPIPAAAGLPKPGSTVGPGDVLRIGAAAVTVARDV
jgi:hypothetical protein